MADVEIEKSVALILAGGIGKRLFPLTADRAKPAVPFGGKYRIVDFVLSNCLHSGVRRILVLTQYKSHSLQKHLRDGWSIFNPEIGEYITPVPPQMRTGESWYVGTADAVYQNLYLLERSPAEWVFVLSGDHIYRMDYAAMLRAHVERGADVTVACMEVDLQSAKGFGVMELGDKDCIVRFEEKPENPKPMPENAGAALASMGVYVFSRDILINALQDDHRLANSGHDFGQDVLPRLIRNHAVYAYRFGGIAGRVSPDRYWRDVGTIDAYYQANMDLLKPVPPLNLYQSDWPIRTYTGQHPPARTVSGSSGGEGIAINSIMSSGVIIAGGSVQESILFSSVFVDDEAIVERSLLFDGVQVGRGAHLINCIVEKGVRIPDGEKIGFDGLADRTRFSLSDAGVVVVPRNYQFKS
jgi:glucose-1-phosphate adenylyltransferase